MDETRITLELTLEKDYAFRVDFGAAGAPDLLLDEPPPLGQGRGPNAARLVAAAVGNCLSASLVYCLRRAHIAVQRLRTTVEASLVRNPRGRLRLGGIRVRLAPEVAAGDRERMSRCLELFEDFCVVTESVRDGIAVDVAVEPAVAGAGAGAGAGAPA